ncbi:IlvD/Edd family dehydratase [Oceanomicrobium pacificus]|uniref:Dihydroxy-acid dehydratase n=1 Tax=Oceanomicrobium pacificus TaxID=2692916 RepID=A0A6B0U1R3_9RHOB|nr:IlvD/Edd family dehydratase [Oceanomicrobium pacificus]MXU65031.1 dihydroxy-acid dehydratase [Oceanomicrobium pacificus]
MSGRKLRSSQWFGNVDKLGFTARGWMKNQGLPDDQFDGRPVIGICNTWSQLTPCNAHLRELAEKVARGVHEAGGFPVEFPVMSLGETLMRPNAMMFRNLAAMDVEETIRANPIDGVVLLAGCDKTTPATVMGAASCDVPTIVVSGGPMLNGRHRGRQIGSGTDVWRLSDELNTGKITKAEFIEAESCMNRSAGSCMTMGTASTMASMVEALGLALPTNAAIPAVDSRRKTLAQMAGRRIVDMVTEDLRISKILTKTAFENAIRVNGAIGGSTNAVLHLIAIAGRIGVDLTLEDWDRLGRDMPCLVNLKPSGDFLMEDFYYAGGLPAVMKEIDSHLDGAAITVTGKPLSDGYADAECFDRDVIRTLDAPFKSLGGIAVLKGNLAPKGAVLKPSAASPKLMQHRGRAVVFETYDDYKRLIDDESFDMSPDDIMVTKMCGPRGYPGFPEVGNMALPRRFLKAGITDMIRISDARMSGTAYGTTILHVAPEAAAGGPLAIVRTGDMIEIDVPNRRLHLDLPEEEIARRLELFETPPLYLDSGYSRLYQESVLQADKGADFDFLVGCRGTPPPKDPF